MSRLHASPPATLPTPSGTIGFLNDQIVVRDPSGGLSTNESFVTFLVAFRRRYARVVLYSRVFSAPAAHAVPLDLPGVDVVELPPYPRIASLYTTPARWWPDIERVLTGPRGLHTLDALWLNCGHPVSVRALRLLRGRPAPRLVAALRGDYETDARLRKGSSAWGRRGAALMQTATLRLFALRARRRGVTVLAYGDAAVRRARRLGMQAAAFETTLVREADMRAPPPADPALAVDLIAVGRLVTEKGLDRLVAALPAIHAADGRPATLALVGDGPLRQTLTAQVGALGLSDRVRFDGYVAPGGDLLTRLRSATALALPSRTEGQPAVALEAMAMGVPIVAAGVGGLPELCGEGRGTLVSREDHGFVERFAAACTALLKEPARRARQVAAGLERARTVTLERQVDRAVALLNAQGPRT